jgi:diguanylate cyclase (GGDEF)-like protein/PAS domain S-box-containing protein
MPFDLQVVPLFVAAAGSLGLGVIAWRRRAPGARAFAVVLAAIAQWATTYAFEIVASDFPGKLRADQLSYIGSALVGPAWLLFTLSYTDTQPRQGRRIGVCLLLLGFCIDQVLVWSEPLRSLMWTYVAMDALDTSLPLSFVYGPAYWVMLAYAYGLLLAGVWLIVRTLVQSGRLYSRQALALLVGVAAPLAANILYEADLVGAIDPTPFAFTLTGLAFFWGFQRYGFLDLAPVARNSIFLVLRDAVLVLDPRDRIVDVNPSAERLLGRAATDLIGKPLGDVLTDLAALIRGVVVDDPADRREIELVGPGATQHYEVRVSALRGHGPRVTGRVVVLADVTERKRAEQVLAHQASHDTLTDLPNRALFRTRLEQAIRDAGRDQCGLALLIIDLNRFKEVTDTLGHESGDLLLRELAARWRSVLRAGDTLARLGGDEFGVVLPAACGRAAIDRTADLLQSALLRPLVLEGHQVEVGASIGIALYPEHGYDAETLLRHADRAMYVAKRSGRSSGVTAGASAAA